MYTFYQVFPLPNCHYQNVTFISLPNCHDQIVLPDCHFYDVTKISIPNCHYQIVNFLNLPNCQLTKKPAYQIVITKLSLPKCHYLIVIIKLSLPNCHYRKSAHRKGSIGRVKALDPLVRQ